MATLAVARRCERWEVALAKYRAPVAKPGALRK